MSLNALLHLVPSCAEQLTMSTPLSVGQRSSRTERTFTPVEPVADLDGWTDAPASRRVQINVSNAIR